MTRHNILRLTAILLTSLLFCACTMKAVSLRSLGTTREKRLAAFVYYPMEHLGGTRKSIQEKLGQPSGITIEKIANRHDPTKIAEIVTLTYPGIVCRIYNVVLFQKELLISVHMTKNHSEMTNVIGLQQPAIEEQLGLPSKVLGTAIEYDAKSETGDDLVTLEISQGIITAVSWSYYVD